jgi:hypothetical protein
MHAPFGRGAAATTWRDAAAPEIEVSVQDRSAESVLRDENCSKIVSLKTLRQIESSANPSISLACGAIYEQLIIRCRSEPHDHPKS